MKNLLLVSVLMFFAGTIFAQTSTPPSAGTGSSGNPYQIATLNNLYWVTQTSGSWGSYFVQTADIDASTSSGWASGAGFSPIGNSTTNFTGSYDGQAHTITGLYINVSTNDIGLFGYASAATIKNVELESVNITGALYVGGLIGNQNGGNAASCFSSGSVTGTGNGNQDIGGLIGSQNGGTATSCYSTGSVTGEGNVGGLIGIEGNLSVDSSCYSIASVTGTGSASESIGGLIGDQANSTAKECYSSGPVTENSSGSFYIGGLIGLQSAGSAATNCYETGNVAGNGATGIGGLIGHQTNANATNCYSCGSVSAGGGGLIGGQGGSNVVSNCFWDTQASGQAGSAGGTGETTTPMKTEATFTGATWDFVNIWSINAGVNNGYPTLQGVTVLPVELTTFTASVSQFTTVIAWKTATEVNNARFDIERQPVTTQQWTTVGSVAGAGTSNAPHNYSYTDNVGTAGMYSYRLKQIDHDGAFTYSQQIEVAVGVAPNVFALGQNYPNPFNPTTNIQFTVPSDGRATLKIFNTLGQEVTTLFDGVATAGEYHQATFDASHLASGMYFSQLVFGGKMQVKKMLLLK
jgi:hypothetical protein